MAGLLVSWLSALEMVSITDSGEPEEFVEYDWLVSAYNGNTNAGTIWQTPDQWIDAMIRGGILKEVEPKRYHSKFTRERV